MGNALEWQDMYCFYHFWYIFYVRKLNQTKIYRYYDSTDHEDQFDVLVVKIDENVKYPIFGILHC